MILAALAGAAIATQAAANGSLKVNLGDARYAAFFSICGTMLTAMFAICILRPPFPSIAVMRATPWWNWIGGPLGASIVLSGAYLTPRLGSAAFITAVVTGQVVCSLGLDHFGALGIPQQSITLGKTLGAGMIITGMLLVKYL
ncbi:MAG: DMT family transporter [Pirellulales bacterium]